jgi:DNA topoisomerase I
MSKNLVIVESPAKAKTIEKFLGRDFTVKSSFGHIRDLSKKDLSVDIDRKFEPIYEISPDKVKVIKDLRKLASEADMIWLASDEDREGEAISWHLVEALSLDEEKTRRIVFHEITKTAILAAIENPRRIDMNLVNAQQARRVLDRLVGYQLSPLLWKKVKPSLSAGRVQSVAVRLIVEREDEIKAFNASASFVIEADFRTRPDARSIKAVLEEKKNKQEDAKSFLEKCLGATYKVESVETKPGKKSPAPPFTTSTLQQDASRKLGFSVSRTMMVAQQLYESGKITYMRTDSVHLSDLALAQAGREIEKLYGKEYVKIRQFKTKTKGAQEAHEAIRPTDLSVEEIDGDKSAQRLYDLIRKRTLASQMSEAQVERTTVIISISSASEKLIAEGEQVKFDGFLKVYLESKEEDEGEETHSLPSLKPGMELDLDEMRAEERYSKYPPRYTEASLVKKLEELGIGRPSTYAPTISTIQKRGYVVKENRPASLREVAVLKLSKDKISEKTISEKFGEEKNKLFPTDIGILVNRFLLQYFENIIDYQFTARVEIEFDAIAEGKKVWNSMIDEFYWPFAKQVNDTQTGTERFSGARPLGTDPKSGRNVYVKVGRFGPMIQIGDPDEEDKPLFASLLKGQSMESIALDDALALFAFPKHLGDHEGQKITVGIGRFGPYVKHGNSFCSIPKGEEAAGISLERAIELLEQKSNTEKQRIILEFPQDKTLRVMNGRYGPYIARGKENFKIPKGQDPAKLSFEDCLKIIDSAPAKKARSGRSK